MRAALSGLTLRGRCFVAAGLASVGCALVLAQPDLLRVGVFLLALPLAALAVVSRTRYRLTCTRRLAPGRVAAGYEVRAQVRVTNVSRMPTGLLLVEDSVPYALGSRPRFVLERLEPRGSRDLDYRVRSDVRGRFRIGPLGIRLADPFGLVELARSFSTTDTLVVTPKVVPLQRVRLGGGTSGEGEAHARSIAAAGEDDVATREYRHGDDLRRVHWRSTAHYGELMVRREEQYWQRSGSLLLDTRSIAHRGDGPGSSFEWAVSATASLGVHLAREGFELSFLTDTGQAVTGLGGTGIGSFEGLLLDTLAVTTTSHNRSLRDAAGALQREGGGNLICAVLGTLDPAEAGHLAKVPRSGALRVAVLIDAASWASLSAIGRERADAAFDASARLLHQAGWRVVPASATDRIDTLWPRVEHGEVMASASRPGAKEGG